jgi:hypothetical protein
MNTNPRVNVLNYKKMFLEQERKNQELQRELDKLKGKTKQPIQLDDNEQENQDQTPDPYAVNIIRVSPFRYKHCTYLIDSTNVLHTYGNIYNGIDSKPIGIWDP